MNKVPISPGARNDAPEDDELSPLEARAVELVELAVRRVLAERPTTPEPTTPRLRDRRQTAAVLGVSLTTLDAMRKEGLPHVLLGDAPRFDVEGEVIPWLRSRGGK